MKILFVTPYTPNLIRVRPYNLLRFLRQAGHEVVLATLQSSAQDREDLSRLSDLGITVVDRPLPTWRSMVNALAAVTTPLPLQAQYCWQPALAAAIDTVMEKTAFDVVHVEHLRGAVYGLHILKGQQAGKRAVPVVWDSVDSISYLFSQAAQSSRSLKGRLMTAFELKRTQRHEAWLARQFNRVLVTSKNDRNAFLALPVPDGLSPLPADQIRVLPNGVDLDFFRPGESPREAASIVFSGKMSYHANVTAAIYLIRDVMPRVWAARPDVKVYLVGKDPTAEVRALARQADAEAGEVIVTGTVPDIRPYLTRATLAAAPIAYGAGIQNKVLEAMACATPVVTTPPAISALTLAKEEGVLIGEDAEAFANAILTLLADPACRERVANAGRRYVETHHDWARIARDLADLYRS